MGNADADWQDPYVSGVTVYKCLVLVYQTLQTCLTYTQICIYKSTWQVWVVGNGIKGDQVRFGMLSGGDFDLW
jgi:hypothetical protein